MNEQLQLALSALIQTSLNAIDKGTTLLSSQIPEVIQQLLFWKALASFLELSFGILLIGSIFVWLLYQYKYWTTRVKDRWNYTKLRINDEEGVLSLLNIFLILPLLHGGSLINLTWLQIWIAPKLYLIEYANTFLK